MKILSLQNRRHFMLLEVMICFALVVLCFLPLIYPHVFMLKAQKQFQKRVELDHVTNLIYADIIEQLYRNEISWSNIVGNSSMPIDENFLRRIHYEGSFSYTGNYSFKVFLSKSNKAKTLTYYHLKLIITFLPQKFTSITSEKQKDFATTFNYDIFVERNLES
jgi:hypothetical protein